MGPPAGRKARWGKGSGGALEGCLSHRDSDPTWSKARDDAYAQKERPGGEPYRPSPFGDFVTPLGDYKLALNKILLPTFHHRKVPPPPGRRAVYAFAKGPSPPPGDHKPAPKYHNKSQLYFPSKIHYLCNINPAFPHNVNFPLKKVKY